MRILALGDVVGSIGTDALRRHMPALKKRYNPDIIIVNGENACENSSITAKNCNALFAMGADVITGGNHSLYNRDMTDIYEREIGALRPANLHPNAPGSGVYVYERGKYRCAVISLIGNVFLDLAYENPFTAADKIIKELGIKHVVIDIHAEATSEKSPLEDTLKAELRLFSEPTPMFPPRMNVFFPAAPRILRISECADP